MLGNKRRKRGCVWDGEWRKGCGMFGDGGGMGLWVGMLRKGTDRAWEGCLPDLIFGVTLYFLHL